MKIAATIELVFAIILIGVFMITLLVFDDIMVIDWIVLAFGVLNLAYYISIKIAEYHVHRS